MQEDALAIARAEKRYLDCVVGRWCTEHLLGCLLPGNAGHEALGSSIG
jgi:hypothetical protein